MTSLWGMISRSWSVFFVITWSPTPGLIMRTFLSAATAIKEIAWFGHQAMLLITPPQGTTFTQRPVAISQTAIFQKTFLTLEKFGWKFIKTIKYQIWF